MDKRELLQVFKALYSLNPSNKAFLETTLLPNATVSLKHYKTEISKAINPSISSPIDIRRGRNAIRDLKKAAPDDQLSRLELMVHFVEQAAAQTLKFGTIDERFYDSMYSMLCLLYTSPSPRDKRQSRMPSSA